ncbi:MAG: hypothetical protein B6U97_00335 [Candidatus Altiarchaeales archaeon ex4484_96]|nr:MAG: hypothetical protein B6U97_00335 [Candidatus Altiarchaeales archaeon ex4484_96]
MNIEIIEERDNPLLKRKEYDFIISFEGITPSRADVRKKLLSVLSSDSKLTILDSYSTEYGMNSAKGLVKVYFDAESMRVEPKHRLARNFPKESKDEVKKESKDEPKAEPTDEPKAEPTDESKAEPTDEPKDESKAEPTDEPKADSTEEVKAESKED